MIEAKERGARLAVVHTRLSYTASHAHLWIARTASARRSSGTFPDNGKRC